MTDLKIRTTVKVPDEIIVELARTDYLLMGNLLRAFFEVFLSLTSASVGVIVSVAESQRASSGISVCECGIDVHLSDHIDLLPQKVSRRQKKQISPIAKAACLLVIRNS